MTPEQAIDLLKPRFRYGNIFPPGGDGIRRGPNYELYRLVPPDVMEIPVPLGIRDYTPDKVEEAMGNFWRCVDMLVREKVDVIVLGGVPVSAQLGRQRVLALLAEVKEKTGIRADAPIEAMIAGLQHLGLNSVTIGSRWAQQLNDALAAYFREAGIEVAAITSRGQWAGEAFGMSLEEGMRMAIEVGREAARQAPQADAIVVPGGAALRLHVIPVLEAEFGKPVFTNISAEVWHNLVHPGIIPPVKGWGRLLETP